MKQTKHRVKLAVKRSHVYIVDLSDIISIRYDLAVKYTSLQDADNQRVNVGKDHFLPNNFSKTRGDSYKVSSLVATNWKRIKFIFFFTRFGTFYMP